VTFNLTPVDVATKDLTGKALAWAVGKVLALPVGLTHDPESKETTVFSTVDGGKMVPFSPQDDWSQCGPLIDKYQINFIAGDRGRSGPEDLPPVQAWLTDKNLNRRPQPADTYPMAACLAIVDEFGGDIVQIPAVLVLPS